MIKNLERFNYWKINKTKCDFKSTNTDCYGCSGDGPSCSGGSGDLYMKQVNACSGSSSCGGSCGGSCSACSSCGGSCGGSCSACSSCGSCGGSCSGNGDGLY